MDKGDYDKALEDCDQPIQRSPDSPEFLISRGFIWHMKGIKDKDSAKCEEKALSDYAAALRLNPKFALALNNRAWILATSKVEPTTEQEITEERIFAEYLKEKKDDLAVPKTILVKRDGKDFLKADVVEMKYLEPVDDSEFEK